VALGLNQGDLKPQTEVLPIASAQDWL